MEEVSLTTIDLGIDGVEDAVEIGRGGFGSVYRARQTALQRTVAVKVLRDAVQDHKVRVRFERECWAMGTLANHPNIITVHGSGFTETGQPFIVMDFMPRGALSDRLADARTVPWPEVASLGVKLAGALETAHRSGVLHRDVKPENVLVSKYAEPQLADFGIARLQGSEETKTDTLTASIAHVSPELLAGEPPSVLSDVYALGSTLFMLLKGRPAFVHDTDQSIVPALTRITSAPVPDLRSDGVPDALCLVIERMMAKDHHTRYQTAEQAGRALQACQEALGQPVSPMTVTGESRRPARPQDGATSAISPAALAAATSGPVVASDSVATSGPVRADSAEDVAVDLAAAPDEPAADPPVARPAPAAPAAPAGTTRTRRPAIVVSVAAGLLVVVLAGLWMRGQTTPEATADPGPVDSGDMAGSGGDPLDEDPVEPSAEDAGLLTAADLDGEWEPDAELVTTVTRPAPAYLCTAVTPAVPPQILGAAFLGGTPGPRVAHSVRLYPPGEAAAFMAGLPEQISCLQELDGLADVASAPVSAGDEAVMLTYTRPGPSDLDVAVGFVRHGDAVAQVVHLGFPITDEDLVHRLLDIAGSRLAQPTG